jgi:hypothetical protein
MLYLSRDFGQSYCRNRRGAQASLAGGVRSSSVEKTRLASHAGLCSAFKSVMVSEVRTVMLTIFWRVCCKDLLHTRLGGIGGNSGDGEMRLAVRRDRKKRAA